MLPTLKEVRDAFKEAQAAVRNSEDWMQKTFTYQRLWQDIATQVRASCGYLRKPKDNSIRMVECGACGFGTVGHHDGLYICPHCGAVVNALGSIELAKGE